jgi:RNA polymerase sigma factor (sigma-70 family)
MSLSAHMGRISQVNWEKPMIDYTATTTILLDGLRDSGNDRAWAEFDRRYRPIVVGFSRKLGLSDADAADVAQETMTKFVQEYQAGGYDRERGRLRSWLMALARVRVAGIYRAKSGRREVAAGPEGIDLEDEARLTAIWDGERRRAMLQEAMERLRQTTKTGENTVRAFELLVLNQLPTSAVAMQLGMTREEVYRAKNRVADRLQSILEELEGTYEEGA